MRMLPCLHGNDLTLATLVMRALSEETEHGRAAFLEWTPALASGCRPRSHAHMPRHVGHTCAASALLVALASTCLQSA